MPTARYNWRQNLSAPRVTPEQLMAQQQAQNLALQKAGQFPLENTVRQAALSRAQSTEAASNYKLQKEIETDRQKTAFYNGLQELEANLNAQGMPIGTKGHAEAFAAYAHEVPLARSTKDVQDTLKLHSLVNDDQAALTQRMQTAMQAGQQAAQNTGIPLTVQGASFIKGGGVDVRYGQPPAPEGIDPEDQLFKSHGIDKTQFLNPVNPVQGTLDANGNFVRNMNPGQTANAIQFQAGTSKQDDSKLISHTMPLNEFNQYRQSFGQNPLPAFVNPNPSGAQPSPPPVVTTTAPINTPIPAQAAQQTTAAPTVDHSAAIDWANANPNDPRSQVILQTAQSALAAQQPQVQSVPGQSATAEPDTTPEEEQ